MSNIVLARLQPPSKIDAGGTPDHCELYCIPRDDLLAVLDPLSSLNIVISHWPLLKRFVTSEHAVVATILDQLHLCPGTPAGKP